MMVRTQVSIDSRLSDALDELSDDEREDRTALIRGAVDRLVQLSGQTAAQALLAWAEEFGQPGMAELIDGHDADLAAHGW
jgi:hypothetical protein